MRSISPHPKPKAEAKAKDEEEGKGKNKTLAARVLEVHNISKLMGDPPPPAGNK